jgi:putative oxidoreductase
VSTPRDPGIVLLRVALAAMLAVHGVYRIAAGGVAPFGEFLASRGFPAGAAIAWAISIFEIAGAALLASGRLVTTVSALFAVQLLFGIWLVHASHGWFVVGGGRNGVEYSVTLIAGFTALILSERARRRGVESAR